MRRPLSPYTLSIWNDVMCHLKLITNIDVFNSAIESRFSGSHFAYNFHLHVVVGCRAVDPQQGGFFQSRDHSKCKRVRLWIAEDYDQVLKL